MTQQDGQETPADRWRHATRPRAVHIDGGADVATSIEVLRSSYPEPSTAPARFPRLGAVRQDRWLSTELRTDGSVLLAFFRQEQMGTTQTQALMDGILSASATGSRFDGWIRPSVGTAIFEAAYAVMMAVFGIGLMVFGLTNWSAPGAAAIAGGLLVLAFSCFRLTSALRSGARIATTIAVDLAHAMGGEVRFDDSGAVRPPIPPVTEVLRLRNELNSGVRLELLTSRSGCLTFVALVVGGSVLVFALLLAAIALFG